MAFGGDLTAPGSPADQLGKAREVCREHLAYDPYARSVVFRDDRNPGRFLHELLAALELAPEDLYFD